MGTTAEEIARLRHTRTGTIKSQCHAVYRKADVTGRFQLISLFVEQLMAEPLMGKTMVRSPGNRS